MNSFNLTAWALRHRAFTGLLMVLLVLGGVMGYALIGQAEDPPFTFRVMVVKTLYPGATATEVEQQVTDRIEKKLQELPNLDYLRSYSKPGEAVVFVTAREDIPADEIPDLWYQVRKKVGDIGHQLPQGVIGPFFNDEFGDTYSVIYALSGEGFGYAELKDMAESARQRLLRVPDVEKVDLIGTQAEKIFVEFSDRKLAELGFSAAQIGEALRGQNAMTAAGRVEEPGQNLPIRVSGRLATADEVADLPFRVNGTTLRVGDVAAVRRGYEEPAEFKMRFNGKDVVGLGLTMNRSGDVLAMGKALKAEAARIQAELPVGATLEQVADQPKVVKRAIGEFLQTFFEALGTVLLVSFLSLGWRAGSVVALTVPLVLAGTLLCMLLLGIGLHRISLGALILALGLLVDDAMIAIEMMARKLDEGWDRVRAATYAYGATAFPMLTGTLITIAGFLPVGLARSSAGEYTVAIFQVVGIALLLSWVGAVIFTPYLGYWMLKGKQEAPGEHFDTPFYRRLRRWVAWCVDRRRGVIMATAALFGLGIVAMPQVPQQFFPLSDRPELMVDLWLPEGSSFAQSEAAARDLEAILAKDNDVVHYATYVGGGSPRFFLLINEQLNHTNLSQTVVMTRDTDARERVLHRLRQAFQSDFPQLRGRISRLDVGPPQEYPVMFRVLGEDPDQVRRIAERVKAVVRAHPHTVDVNDDWNERLASLRLQLDQDKARALGVSSLNLAQALRGHYTGLPVGQFREGNELIDIVWRARQGQREGADGLPDVSVQTGNGRAVPLSQLARLET
ncbi:MAG: efflux RND transporter permease subunit, partial [Methylococcaceae bacterium]|nr:efflux RND transporter permease subunit [Methylococcaceae bacterium]